MDLLYNGSNSKLDVKISDLRKDVERKDEAPKFNFYDVESMVRLNKTSVFMIDSLFKFLKLG